VNTKISKTTSDNLKKEIAALPTDLILIIIDHNISSLYSKVLNLQEIEGKKVIVWKAPDGEKVKNIKEYESCVEYFLDKGIHRKTHLIAFGGGATSDFAGFVAATLLRGIKWSVIPTTLLAMVDASIGGKVAINSKEVKNLIGAFHKPENIWMNYKFLETLPPEEMKSGKGEILKYALLEKSIHDLVIKDAQMEEIINACGSFKLKLTEEDFQETGKRKILNLGHTFGHALEKIYNLSHGVAVLWGMAVMDIIYNQSKNLNVIKELKSKLSIDEEKSPWIKRDFPMEKIIELVKKDKKMVSNFDLEVVVVHEIGKPDLKTVDLETLANDVSKVQNELKNLSL